MNPLFDFVGVGLLLLGAAVWRFKLIDLLSNVDAGQVDPAPKGALARYAGGFIAVIGAVFLLLGYLAKKVTTEREVVVLIACLIPMMMVIAVLYMVGLGRFMKK